MAQDNALPKMVWADYFPHHRTREHDGNLGSWFQSRTAEQSGVEVTTFTYNADLIDGNGHHQLPATIYPLVGMQSDMDPDYLEYQILQAKVAHIDGFVIEFVMPGDNTWTHTTLKLMEVARKYDFQIGVDIIEGSFFDWIKYRPNMDTREKQLEAWKLSIQWMIDEIYAKPTGVVVDGHPVFFLFAGGLTPDEHREHMADFELPPHLKEPWWVKRAGIGPQIEHTHYAYKQWDGLINGMFGWLCTYNFLDAEVPAEIAERFDKYETSDGLLHYQNVVMQKGQEYVDSGLFDIRVNSVCPGFDNRGCAGWGNDLSYISREAGATLRKQWEFIAENRGQIDGALLVTWNDYTESTCVEPTVEFGFHDMEQTEKHAATFKGIESDASGIQLPFDLYELRKAARFLTNCGVDAAALTEKLDASAAQIASGEYAASRADVDAADELAEALRAPIAKTELTLTFPSDDLVAAGAAGALPHIQAAEPIAEQLRDNHFEGFATFEYLDDGDAFFTLKCDSARANAPGDANTKGEYDIVARIKRTGTGEWVSARVKLFKANCAFSHGGDEGADLWFVDEGDGLEVRNVGVEATVYRAD
ncbi:MAG TPA: hypothetical protein QGH10_08590 [Armatimonadota bacterium]|nr:hypothetical protein [Armatimonadota bacterium]